MWNMKMGIFYKCKSKLKTSENIKERNKNKHISEVRMGLKVVQVLDSLTMSVLL
jgi:hypothetical protein